MAAAGLLGALEAEHAAIFGYGVVGARLDRSTQSLARSAETAHRDRRDSLALIVAAAGASPPPAAAAYQLPFAVTDRPSALRLAIALEEGAAAAWRQALGTVSGQQRRAAVDALCDCAVWATRWRRLAGVTPATVPFPGTPT